MNKSKNILSKEAIEAAQIIIKRHLRHRGYIARVVQSAIDKSNSELAATTDRISVENFDLRAALVKANT